MNDYILVLDILERTTEIRKGKKERERERVWRKEKVDNIFTKFRVAKQLVV